MSNSLSKPVFSNPDPLEVESKAINRWESITNKPLFPAQPERLFINQIAYWLTTYLASVQYTGEQELVNYAVKSNLDQLGELMDCKRLLTKKATTSLRFTVKDTLPTRRVFAAGVMVQDESSGLIFITTTPVVVVSHASQGFAEAQCETTGSIGNGLVTGKITKVLNETSFSSVTNITETGLGMDSEDDARYRDRIKLAPQSFSNAGSIGAYKYWAMSASSMVRDVNVTSSKRTIVDINVLFYGEATTILLDLVKQVVGADTVRPLTDIVNVIPAIPVDYTIEADIYLSGSSIGESEMLSNLYSAAHEYAEVKRSKLGLDIVPEEIIAALFIKGVYRVVLSEPSEVIELNNAEYGVCTDVILTIKGYNRG